MMLSSLSTVLASLSIGASMNAMLINKNNCSSVTSKIILYDGVCNLCNSLVDLLLKLDKDERFSFNALQSTRGKELMELIGKGKNDISSLVYIKSLGDANEVFFKSDAALKVGITSTVLLSYITDTYKLL